MLCVPESEGWRWPGVASGRSPSSLPITSDAANLVPFKAAGSTVDLIDVNDDMMMSANSIIKDVTPKGESCGGTLMELPPPIPISLDTIDLFPVKVARSTIDLMDVNDNMMMSLNSVIKAVTAKGESAGGTLMELPRPLPILSNATDLVSVKAARPTDLDDNMLICVSVFKDATEFEASSASAKGESATRALDSVSSIGFTDVDICFAGTDVCPTGDEISLSNP